MLSEVDQLVANLLQPVIQMIAHGVVILAMIGLLLVYDPKMAVIVAAVVATLYGLIYLVVHGILGRIGSDRSKANEERFLACGEALGGIKEVKVTGPDSSHSPWCSRCEATIWVRCFPCWDCTGSLPTACYRPRRLSTEDSPACALAPRPLNTFMPIFEALQLTLG